jgi:electron transfer flavoprotein alpha subunit
MKTVVLVKQVPDVSQMQFDPETRTLRREGVRLEVSSFDVRALLRAIELRTAHGGEVVALTMGPPQAKDALLHCLALGADRAIHLVDRAFAGADTLATARALARALGREGFDLVLCGRSSVDAETGQVGPEVAELLDVPQVVAARTLEIDPVARRLRAERETDAGFETLECPLPALVTAAEDLAPERYPKKAEKEAAKAKPIVEWTAADLGGDASSYGAAGSPTWVEAIETREESRAGERLEGSPEEIAARLVARLGERGAFSSRRSAAKEDILRGAIVPDRALWVVAETLGGALRPVTFELLGRAVELAAQSGGEVAAVLVGHGVGGLADRLAAHGADRVFVADAPALASYATEPWTAVLARAIETRRPRTVLFPSTYFGRDLAPRLAARLGLGLTGDCVDLSLDAEGRLIQWKPAFGGNVVAPILTRTLPEMATVRPGMLAAHAPDPSRSATVETLPATDLPEARARIVAERPIPGLERAAALDEAEIAIGVGMGVGADGMPEIERFAAALGGAAIATTRDVCDAGWLPRQHQVGLTGRAISPALYVAIGIRGAFEHVVGVRRAGTIVAIDKNPKSPMLAAADIAIAAEWRNVLPAIEGALVEALRKR